MWHGILIFRVSIRFMPNSPDFVHSDMMVRELMKALMPFVAMEGATEIIINRPCEVFVETGPHWQRFEAPLLTHGHLMSLVRAIAVLSDQEIGPQRPILSAMLPDGERIQIVLPPAVEADTLSVSIRKPAASIHSLEHYEREGAFSRFIWARAKALTEVTSQLDPVDQSLIKALDDNRLIDFLKQAVISKKNIAVVGETGSGKTTLMKSLCQHIPAYERLMTIEDVRELFLPHHPNRVHLLYSKGGQGVAKITPSDLIAATMRMKPDRVLLAELRGGEAFDFLKLLTTGHSGSITSYHAESCALAAERYVFMCKEHEDAAIYDAAALKALVTLTLDIIIHVSAKVVCDEKGQALSKTRFVSEVHFDPIARRKIRFGDAQIHQAWGE